MESLSFEEVKRIELDMLVALDRICKANNLTYLIAFGTCLGAMRHGGFIPWDDDIDVYMPRDDYERLAGLIHKDDTPYVLSSYRDGKSPNVFFKLCDPSTVMYERFLGKRFPEGVWIDIFPLDRINPESPAVRRTLRRRKRLNLLRGFIVTDPTTGATTTARLAKKIICPIAQHLDYIKVCRMMDEQAMATTDASGADRSLPRSEGYYGELVAGGRITDASLLFPTKPLTFESVTFEGPAEPEKYLEQIYGDWRKLPPEEERIPHHVEAYRL